MPCLAARARTCRDSTVEEWPLRVRNTFIEGCPSAVRSSSLEPFMRRRKAQSCPSSPVRWQGKACQDPKDDATCSPRSTQICDSDTDVSVSCSNIPQEDDWEGSCNTQDHDLHTDAAKDAFAGLSTPLWEEMPLYDDVFFNAIPWSFGMAAERSDAVFCAADALLTDVFWVGRCQDDIEVPILLQELGDQGGHWWYVAQDAAGAERSNDEPRLVLSLAEALGVPATSPASTGCEAHEVGVGVSGSSLGGTGFVQETSDASSHMQTGVAGPVAFADSGSVDGLPGLPSAGSALHSIGLCKPCSFLQSAAGCGKGQACRSCHLCDTGVGRWHKKDKMQRRKRLETLGGPSCPQMGSWPAW